MKAFLKDLRFMIRDAWHSRGSGKATYKDSFGKTLRETSHVRGGKGGAWSSGEATIKHVKDGHADYAKSFEDSEDLDNLKPW